MRSVQQGRLLLCLLVLGRNDAHLVGVHDGGIGRLCRLFVVEPLCRKSGEEHDVFGRGELELEIGRRLESLVFQITGADDGKRGCLNTSQRPHTASGSDGESLRSVDADDPIGFAAGFGREVEVVVLLARPEVLQPLADRLVGEAADPQSHERLAALQKRVDVAENQFALASCIGCDDDTVGHVEQFFDDGELFEHTRIGLILLALSDLAGQEDELRRQDRQVFRLETLDAVLLGHGELDEVSEGPCHDVAVPLDITLPAVLGAHDGGDLPRHRGLFCDDYLHDKFGFFSGCVALVLFSDGRSAYGRSKRGCRFRRSTVGRPPVHQAADVSRHGGTRR